MLPGDFLYLDESGDLGIGADCTPAFVIAILHLRSETALARVAKRARRRALGKGAPLNELKWSLSSPAVRWAVVEQIRRERHQVSGISAVAMDKGWINPAHAQRSGDVRYNYAVRLALEKGNLFGPLQRGRRIKLTVDARNARATASLAEYVSVLAAGGELCCELTVRGADSLRTPQLQAADFVAGTIFSAYARDDWKFLNAIKDAGIEVSLRRLSR